MKQLLAGSAIVAAIVGLWLLLGSSCGHPTQSHRPPEPIQPAIRLDLGR